MKRWILGVICVRVRGVVIPERPSSVSVVVT